MARGKRGRKTAESSLPIPSEETMTEWAAGDNVGMRNLVNKLAAIQSVQFREKARLTIQEHYRTIRRMAWMLRVMKYGGKYRPHQSLREQRRRIKQMLPKHVGPHVLLINKAQGEWRDKGIVSTDTMALLDAAGYVVDDVISTFVEEKRDNG